VIGNFLRCLTEVLKHEGGYVNHPLDPGGMTNLGVTRRVWEEWTGKPADETIMRGLTRDMVAPLYKAKYWDAVKGDDLPSGVDYAVFDIAVNSGPRKAAVILQEAMGVTADGVIGPKTLQAAKVAPPVGLIGVICNKRMDFLRSLPHFKTFGEGWTVRVKSVRKTASEMVRPPATP